MREGENQTGATNQVGLFDHVGLSMERLAIRRWGRSTVTTAGSVCGVTDETIWYSYSPPEGSPIQRSNLSATAR